MKRKYNKQAVGDALTASSRAFLYNRSDNYKQRFLRHTADAMLVGRGFALSVIDKACPTHEQADELIDYVFGRKT